MLRWSRTSDYLYFLQHSFVSPADEKPVRYVSSFIFECNIAWKLKIEKPRLHRNSVCMRSGREPNRNRLDY
jgi:hypothetical protein